MHIKHFNAVFLGHEQTFLGGCHVHHHQAQLGLPHLLLVNVPQLQAMTLEQQQELALMHLHDLQNGFGYFHVRLHQQVVETRVVQPAVSFGVDSQCVPAN